MKFDKNNYHLMGKCQTVVFCGHSALLEDSEGRISIFWGAVLKQKSRVKDFFNYFNKFLIIMMIDVISDGYVADGPF